MRIIYYYLIIVKFSRTNHDDTLRSLHPFTIMPYDSPIVHISKVALYTPDVFYHYHYLSKKNTLSSVETRALRTIRSKLESIEVDLNTLKASVESGLKQYPPVTSCLLSQKDKCTKAKVGQYVYSICMLGEAKQDSTRLGTWTVDIDKDYALNRTVEYVGGVTCWNGIQRKLVVEFSCGEKEEIVSLSEPSTCNYHATMKSPCFCTDEYVDSLKKKMEISE